MYVRQEVPVAPVGARLGVCEASSTWADSQRDDACTLVGRAKRAVRKQLDQNLVREEWMEESRTTIKNE